MYRKTRYLSASEAMWRLLGFNMYDRYPAVTKIYAHLKGEQYVTFPASATQEQRLQITEATHSPLMNYFARPANDFLTVLPLFLTTTNSTPSSSQKKTPPYLQHHRPESS